MDGSLLAHLLVQENYRVVGLDHPKANLTHLEDIKNRVEVRPFELPGTIDSLMDVFRDVAPQLVFHLAAISSPMIARQDPDQAMKVNFDGTANLLYAVAAACHNCRVLHASSSKIFGDPVETPQDEETPMGQTSDPYSRSKQMAHLEVDDFRKRHDLWSCNSIAFNHEHPWRGPDFITSKITKAAAQISLHKQEHVTVGNLSQEVDWGYAPDYVRAMLLILKHKKPENFVLATGATHSIEQLCQIAFDCVGRDWKNHVVVDPNLAKPTTGNKLVGDRQKRQDCLDGNQPNPLKKLSRKWSKHN